MHDNDAPIIPTRNTIWGHVAMGHQGIAKVLARIQERHTCPSIRKRVGQYVGQCLT